MMAGNPNRWSMHPAVQLTTNSHEFINSSSIDHPTTCAPDQDFPVRSWSQLLLGGLGGGEEEKFGGSVFQQQKKLENWEDQLVNLQNPSTLPIRSNNNNNNNNNHVKQEVAVAQQVYDHELIHPNKPSINSWSHHQMNMPHVSSCITTLTNTFFNFSGAEPEPEPKPNNHHHDQHHSSECNSTSSGGVSKKLRVQQSSPQPALKVRKEKLGDRITALHQLVSPFGKTDTASVLSEAIGYIRFLQGQIEALSSPYMRSGSVSSHGHHPQHSVQERSCLFPEEGGQDSQSRIKDLRSRGLCLVPISCTQNVENDNGADYWAPATLGGGF